MTKGRPELPQNQRMNKVFSPLQALVVQWLVAPGDVVRAGDVVVILEAMKMEHEVRATADGRVKEVLYAVGKPVHEGDLLLISELLVHIPKGLGAEKMPEMGQNDAVASATLAVRPDLQRVIDRHAPTLDANRAQVVAKRHTLGLRTARENISDLCDDGSFMEYGALAVAAQRSRRTYEDLWHDHVERE